MPPDARRLQPDHHPTPFSADEIRLGCPPGRTVRALVVQAGSEPFISVVRFATADAEGADQEFWRETPDGVRLTEPQRRRSTWREFQGHASMPAESTEIADEEIEIPAGRFACLRYTRHEGTEVSTFWFAKVAAGMPLKYESRVNGELVYASTAIENSTPG